jgi:D-cysteine desulfhydrase
MNKDIASLIRAVPRVGLLSGATPLDRASRLSEELGVDLLLKRDDLTGIGAGGNKLRKLEFIVAAAQKEGATALITTGGAQSNHARLTAAVATRFGLKCYLRLKGQAPAGNLGNVLLDRLFDADLDFWDEPNYDIVNQRMAALAEALRKKGEHPVTVPLGGATPEGTLGYALAFAEILSQASTTGRSPDYVVLAAGTGSTQAGLLLGAKLSGAATRVIGVSVSWAKGILAAEVARHTTSAAQRLGIDLALAPDDIWVAEGYVGPGYAKPSPLGRAALTRMARREGVLLDSTYTAKGMSGAIDLIERGVIPQGSRVVFVHTGGAPEIYTRSIEELCG